MWLPSARVWVVSVTISAEYGAFFTTRPGTPASAPRNRAPPGAAASPAAGPKRPCPRPGPGFWALAATARTSRPATVGIVRIDIFSLLTLLEKTHRAGQAIGAQHHF